MATAEHSQNRQATAALTRVVWGALLIGSLYGCGQKGPLVLPAPAAPVASTPATAVDAPPDEPASTPE